MIKYTNNLFRLGCAVLALGVSTPALAEKISEFKTEANYVGGHRFTPSFIILTPFSTPSVSTALLFAYMTPEAQFGNQDLKVAGFSPTLEAQIPIYKKLTIPIRATGFAAAGINAISALNFGATTGYRVQTGALYQFIESDTLALTGALTISKPHLFAASPLVTAQQLIKGIGQGTSTELDFGSESTQWYPSIRAAYAFNPTFGLQGNAGVQIFTGTDDQDSRTQAALSLGFDTQLKPRYNVPIALQLIYARNQLITRAGAQNSDTLGFSVFETFSERFNFGGEIGWIRTGDKNPIAFGFISRYYY